MNRAQFFGRAVSVLGAKSIASVTHAYWLAKATHRGQNRDEGERYFEHCRRVALILLETGKTSPNQLVVALLHDCVEDGFLPEHLLTMLFGQEVADAVSVLSKAVPVFDENSGAVKEKLKKPLSDYYAKIAGSPEWVQRVKLADRLDNVRTMGIWPRTRIEKYLRETDDFILSIAEAVDQELYQQLLYACSVYRARH